MISVSTPFPRGPHPADPDCLVFPANHWPLPQPHEGHKTPPAAINIAAPGPEAKESTKKAKKAKKDTSTTGLVCLRDFIEEAKRASVLTPQLREKLSGCFSSPAPNNGMRRMRANNLLRGAIRRKSKEF